MFMWMASNYLAFIKPDVPKHYLGFSFDRLSDH